MESERVELHKSLVDDIIKGMEEVEKLKVSSPSRQRMLTCHQEALFLLTGRDPRGQCHSLSLMAHSDSPSAGSSSLKRKYGEDIMCHRIITSGKDGDEDDGYKWRLNRTQKMLGSEFPRCYYSVVNTTAASLILGKEGKRCRLGEENLKSSPNLKLGIAVNMTDDVRVGVGAEVVDNLSG